MTDIVWGKIAALLEKQDVIFITTSLYAAHQVAHAFIESLEGSGAEYRYTVTTGYAAAKNERTQRTIRFCPASIMERGMDGYCGEVILHFPILDCITTKIGTRPCLLRDFVEKKESLCVT